jgi:hypothetical protein
MLIRFDKMISTRAPLYGTRETPEETMGMLSSHTENRTNDVIEIDLYDPHAAIPFCASTEYYSGGDTTQRNEPPAMKNGFASSRSLSFSQVG